MLSQNDKMPYTKKVNSLQCKHYRRFLGHLFLTDYTLLAHGEHVSFVSKLFKRKQ